MKSLLPVALFCLALAWEAQTAAPAALTPEAQAIEHQEHTLLARALAQLPEDQRTAVELHHLRDASVAEIAARLGRTEASIAGLLRRGLQNLRTLLHDPNRE